MPFYGEGLDGLMRARANSLRGIVNGIDYDEFNPETDRYICLLYTSTSQKTGAGDYLIVERSHTETVMVKLKQISFMQNLSNYLGNV